MCHILSKLSPNGESTCADNEKELGVNHPIYSIMEGGKAEHFRNSDRSMNSLQLFFIPFT